MGALTFAGKSRQGYRGAQRFRFDLGPQGVGPRVLRGTNLQKLVSRGFARPDIMLGPTTGRSYYSTVSLEVAAARPPPQSFG